MALASSLERLSDTLKDLTQEDLSEQAKDSLTDFQQKKKAYKIQRYQAAKKEVSALLHTSTEESAVVLCTALAADDLEKIKETVTTVHISPVQGSSSLDFSLPDLPSEIKADMKEDLRELQQCFQNDCYRASVILCGRLLETALHRKYFDATQFDILEKNPGIGLGTLIAKMKEKDISLSPSIAQQVHLINQVRIYSVHKKKETFRPNKNQTQATILFTLDTIRRLFL